MKIFVFLALLSFLVISCNTTSHKNVSKNQPSNKRNLASLELKDNTMYCSSYRKYDSKFGTYAQKRLDYTDSSSDYVYSYLAKIVPNDGKSFNIMGTAQAGIFVETVQPFISKEESKLSDNLYGLFSIADYGYSHGFGLEQSNFKVFGIIDKESATLAPYSNLKIYKDGREVSSHRTSNFINEYNKYRDVLNKAIKFCQSFTDDKVVKLNF